MGEGRMRFKAVVLRPVGKHNVDKFSSGIGDKR